MKLKEGSGNYSSPRMSSEVMDCSMPLTFDSYSYCSMGCLYCVTGETMIQAPTKSKKIKDLKIKDKIFSYNIQKKIVEIDQVTSFMKRNVSEVIEIELENNKKIKVTPEHPVYTKNKGWMDAGKLQEGDDILFIKKAAVSFNNTHFYTVSKKGSESISNRMKKHNPMHNIKSAHKMGTTRHEKYLSGELIPPALGKPRPDVVKRMTGSGNPMKNPKIRKPTLQKIVNTWVKNGKISEGEIKVREALEKMNVNFIHQFVVDGPSRNYSLDFFLPDKGVCIEYDGHSKHYTEKGKKFDLKRDAFILRNDGIKTVRIHRDEAFIGDTHLINLIEKRLP